MPVLNELRNFASGFSTSELLRYLIQERFAGKTVVTASLRSSAIVVLKMVADIDPETPVVFCRRGSSFPESREHHERVVSQLGLKNVITTRGLEPEGRSGNYDHCEQMWVEYEFGPGRSFEIVHLNDILKPYECWVSAVYHVKRPDNSRFRIDMEDRVVRIDPLAGWSTDEVRTFMRDHALPFHKRAYRNQMRLPHRDDPSAIETYHV